MTKFNFNKKDTIFVFGTAIVISIIYGFGFQELVSKYIIIFLWVAYGIGRYTYTRN